MAAIGYQLAEAKEWKGVAHAHQQLDDALAVMGRYGKQDMVRLSREIDVRQLFMWVRAIDRLVERENKPIRRW